MNAPKKTVAKKTTAKATPEQVRIATKFGSRMRKPLDVKPLKKRKQIPSDPLLLDPKKLKPHPLLGRAGMLQDLIEREEKSGAKDGSKRESRKERARELREEFAEIEHSVTEDGIKDFLKVCKDKNGNWLILDGRHRTEIAIKHKLPTVPCKEYPAKQAREIIMAASVRRHISKGAKAYQVVRFYPEVAKQKAGGNRNHSALNAECLTAERLATKIGVSLRLMEDAISLYKTFQEREDARVLYEASIYAGVSLAKVKCAVGSFIATGEEVDAEPENDTTLTPEQAKSAKLLASYGEQLRELSTVWEQWTKLGKTARASAVTLTIKRIKAAPAELKDAIIKVLTEEDE